MFTLQFQVICLHINGCINLDVSIILEQPSFRINAIMVSPKQGVLYAFPYQMNTWHMYDLKSWRYDTKFLFRKSSIDSDCNNIMSSDDKISVINCHIIAAYQIRRI